MASCRSTSFEAEVVRLVHGDASPDGPRVMERPVASDLNGTYAGREQRLPRGSYALDGDHAAFECPDGLTLLVCVFATSPGGRVQALVSNWCAPDGTGYGLGSTSPLVRADMVYFATASGAGVFSVGSVSYCGSRSHNGYDNGGPRVTANVLRRFLSCAPLP